VKAFVTLDRYDLRVQFAQLLTNRAGAEIDMSVLNRKCDYFDTLQVPCSNPGALFDSEIGAEMGMRPMWLGIVKRI
jgi:hypothetical protein